MLIFWSCAAAILVLALIPTSVPYTPTTGWDKSNHVLAFAVLAALGCRAYPRHIAAVLASAILYGGLIEVMQSFTPDRMAEWADLFADAIGAVVGCGLMAIRWAGRK